MKARPNVWQHAIDFPWIASLRFWNMAPLKQIAWYLTVRISTYWKDMVRMKYVPRYQVHTWMHPTNISTCQSFWLQFLLASQNKRVLKHGVEEHYLLEQLPTFLRHDLAWFLNQQFLEKLPMFYGADTTGMFVCACLCVKLLTCLCLLVCLSVCVCVSLCMCIYKYMYKTCIYTYKHIHTDIHIHTYMMYTYVLCA